MPYEIKDPRRDHNFTTMHVFVGHNGKQRESRSQRSKQSMPVNGQDMNHVEDRRCESSRKVRVQNRGCTMVERPAELRKFPPGDSYVVPFSVVDYTP